MCTSLVTFPVLSPSPSSWLCCCPFSLVEKDKNYCFHEAFPYVLVPWMGASFCDICLKLRNNIHVSATPILLPSPNVIPIFFPFVVCVVRYPFLSPRFSDTSRLRKSLAFLQLVCPNALLRVSLTDIYFEP